VWSSSGQLAKRSKARKIATVLDSQRDIPFALFQQIITSGIEYFVLQKDVSLADEHALSARHEITIYKNAFDNFSDTAALTSEMDLIISVDTAVAHLAGALGKPVWILFPHSHQNLLAIVGREESPWYPTARLFRQPQPDDWESVISQVKGELEKFAP
jgi:ADP-heptose:LPS heptosyltransferase